MPYSGEEAFVVMGTVVLYHPQCESLTGLSCSQIAASHDLAGEFAL